MLKTHPSDFDLVMACGEFNVFVFHDPAAVGTRAAFQRDDDAAMQRHVANFTRAAVGRLNELGASGTPR